MAQMMYALPLSHTRSMNTSGSVRCLPYLPPLVPDRFVTECKMCRGSRSFTLAMPKENGKPAPESRHLVWVGM